MGPASEKLSLGRRNSSGLMNFSFIHKIISLIVIASSERTGDEKALLVAAAIIPHKSQLRRQPRRRVGGKEINGHFVLSCSSVC